MSNTEWAFIKGHRGLWEVTVRHKGHARVKQAQSALVVPEGDVMAIKRIEAGMTLEQILAVIGDAEEEALVEEAEKIANELC